MDDPLLEQLQQTLEAEMPITRAMGVTAVSWDNQRLAMEMPLEPNRNHQTTAFAGSINALCTIAGWGTLYLLMQQQSLAGNIVIRRSKIRYLRPVLTPRFIARSQTPDLSKVSHFFELFRCKGRSKLDVDVAILDDRGPLGTFVGSYVVLEEDSAPGPPPP